MLYPNTEELYLRRVKYTYGHARHADDGFARDRLERISGAAGTILSPSGLAAIAVALLSVAKAGGHLLVTDSAYRPTRNFPNTLLKRMGVETTYYEPTIGADIASLIRPETFAVVVGPGSQSFEMQGHSRHRRGGRARDACVVMDNTWATPLFFPPHERGVDLAIGPARNICRAISTCCSVSSPRTPNGGRPRRPDCTAACAGRRTYSWRCAGCARWSFACAKPSGRALRWRHG